MKSGQREGKQRGQRGFSCRKTPVLLQLTCCTEKAFVLRACSRCSYVVDSADPNAIPVSKRELHELLSKSSLGGIPLLVLANKSDKPDAVTKDEMIAQM